jgi:ferritin-like metal-binding protein YciE
MFPVFAAQTRDGFWIRLRPLRPHSSGDAFQLRLQLENSNVSRTFAMPSDSLETLHDLFVHELRDLYDAENQLIKALPLMSQAAQSPELKRAFDTHLRETKEQVRRLEQVFKGMGEKPTGKSCKAMQGLVEEGNELLEEDVDPDVMDAALIVAAQKIEHYEIASYGSVCTFGRVLGYDDATEILKETMAEEERTDKLLTGIASKLNPQAESADEGNDSATPGGDTEGMTDQQMSAGRGNDGGGNRMSGTNRMSSAGKRRSNTGGSTRGRSSSRSKNNSGGKRRSSNGGRKRTTARSRR